MMTICPTSPDVGECAEAVCDQHLPNQLKTVADTLAYALNAHGVDSQIYGNPTHADRVVGDWAASDWEHFLWLSFYGFALAEETDIRFGEVDSMVGKVIASGQVGLLLSDKTSADWCSPQSWFTAANSKVEKGKDLFDCHRKHVLRGYAEMAENGHPPTWTGVNPPLWVLRHAR